MDYKYWNDDSGNGGSNRIQGMCKSVFNIEGNARADMEVREIKWWKCIVQWQWCRVDNNNNKPTTTTTLFVIVKYVCTRTHRKDSVETSAHTCCHFYDVAIAVIQSQRPRNRKRRPTINTHGLIYPQQTGGRAVVTTTTWCSREQANERANEAHFACRNATRMRPCDRRRHQDQKQQRVVLPTSIYTHTHPSSSFAQHIIP